MTPISPHSGNCEDCALRRQLCEASTLFEEKVIELSTIREAGCSLQYINDFSRVCEHLLGCVLNNTPAGNCSIMLFDELRQQLFLVAAGGHDDAGYVIDIKDLLSHKNLRYGFKSGEGIEGQAVQKREVMLDNGTEDGSAVDRAERRGTGPGSRLSVPLMIRGKAFGVLNLCHSAKNAFREQDLNVIHILANFIALVVHAALEHEKLKISEEKYRVISEYSNDGIVILQDGFHIYANPRYCELTGYDARELRSIPFHSLVFGSDPGEPASGGLPALDFRFLQEPLETRLITRWGDRSSVEISASEIVYDGTKAVIVIVRDLADRKRLEEQLLQAQKMEAVGTLAGGIAHDFNNLLQAILGYGELLLRDTDGGNRQQQKLQQIVSVAKRGAQLTRQLLTFSRKIEAEPQFIDLNLQIEDLKDLLVRIIPKNIDIEIHLADGLKIVSVDPTQIE
ncbi:MAG: PAS domain S-box protein, partial [Syntrophobacteraceae bacterium]